jgi:hypothetical protein
MSYYENQLSSIFTILSVQLINTGNRSLDNAIIALITIAIGQVLRVNPLPTIFYSHHSSFWGIFLRRIDFSI